MKVSLRLFAGLHDLVGSRDIVMELPDDAPVGMHTLRVVTKHGVSNFRPFVVDDLPVVAETDANRTKDTAQAVPVPAVSTR